jgi:hypothetical protein
MVLMEIHNIFLNRKNNILQMLKNQEGTIALEKKHELIGAMCEIDLVLKTLEYYSINGRKESNEINLLTNPEEDHESLFTRLFKGKRE